MRSFITAVLLGLGVLGTTAAIPQQAQASGPWHGRYYGFGNVHYYGPHYYGPGVTVVSPYVAPAVVAPAAVGPTVVTPQVYGPVVAPYASFSIGTYGRGGPGWYGGYRGYYRHH